MPALQHVEKNLNMDSTSSDSLSTEALIHNATQNLSHSSSSLSTDALIHIASQPVTTFLRDLESSTPEDVSLSDDDRQVQKATKHLQQFSRLISTQTPSSSSDSDGDFNMPIQPTSQSPHLPLDEDPPALPSKLGK
jgi:hypothetical protein